MPEASLIFTDRIRSMGEGKRGGVVAYLDKGGGIPPGRQNHPPTPYGQPAVDTYPTGMNFCVSNFQSSQTK